MVGIIESTNLEIGKVYHIKDNKTSNIDKLWFNQYTLVNKEKWYDDVILLIFQKDNDEIAIDADFVSVNDGENYNIIHS